MCQSSQLPSVFLLPTLDYKVRLFEEIRFLVKIDGFSAEWLMKQPVYVRRFLLQKGITQREKEIEQIKRNQEQ